jgi:phage terminase large subunit
MTANNIIPASENQMLAIRLLKSNAVHHLLVGGSRSGKSAIIVDKQISRSYQFPGSRRVAARLNYSDVKATLWNETILKALKRYPESSYTVYYSDPCHINFKNGSEYWIGGFDTAERTEKLLGHEYADMYFNEISQINYATVTLGQTRLAQKIDGCRNVIYYDCNPPSPLHWSYKLFIQKADPKTNKPLTRSELYDWFRLNPIDNKSNLPENYISDFLETLPERDKQRFLYGEFCKQEGAIYDEFNDNMIITADKVPPIEDYAVGLDFGINSVAILVGFAGDRCYVLDEICLYNSTASMLNQEMIIRWGDKSYIAFCDPSGGERLQEISYSHDANNSVEPGIDCIRKLMHENNFYVVDKCRGVIDGLVTYCRDEKERIVKEDDHEMDALRYGVFSQKNRVSWGLA